ncbi:MAG: hypothetical protein AB8B56_01425 [Crocinitomicaceae bacterium]
MKKDTLKALFENENVTKLESMHLVIGGATTGGGQANGSGTKQDCLTNGGCTSGDVGCCDNDTSKRADFYDQPCGEVPGGGTVD